MPHRKGDALGEPAEVAPALTGVFVVTSGAATVPARVAIELALTWMSGGGVK